MNLKKFNSNVPDKISLRDSINTIIPYSFPTLAVLILLVLFIIFQPELNLLVTNNALTDFDSMIVENGFHRISLQDGRSWKLEYEKDPGQSFSGMIRHASPILHGKFAVLSHDLLITRGDFQNPELVSTRVSNHHFSWKSITGSKPRGSINLLHTLPMNQDVFRQLQQLENGDLVTIRGYEIYRIDGWDAANRYIGYWKDSGCNTILVTEVIFEE